jgi:CRISPR-associated protein Cmr5
MTTPTSNPPSSQRTLQQKRAESAWTDIESVKTHELQKNYGSLVRGFPAMIQTDGLGPALAFLKAKSSKNPQHLELNRHISEWVLERMGITNQGDLLTWVMKQSTEKYRQAAVEALAYLMWLKRFAEAAGWGDEDRGGR